MVAKFVQELMSRSRYEYFACSDNKNFAAGYTIRIRKKYANAAIASLKKEIDQLSKWAYKEAGFQAVQVLHMPQTTRFTEQYAIVTIFDPVMHKIEQYIPKKG